MQTFSLTDSTKIIREIYNSLEDEISKNIYKERLNLIIEPFEISNLIYNASPYCKELYNNNKIFKYGTFISKNSFLENEPFIFYGVGKASTNIFNTLFISDKIRNELIFNGRDIYFCDKKAETIKTFLGYPVITPEELVEKFPKSQVMICTYLYIEEVCKFLVDNNYKPHQILHYYNICDFDNQYFEKDIIKLSENEVFVDAGVFNGETSLLFSEKVNHKYKQIYLFEPNEECRNNSLTNLDEKKLKNYKMFPFGLWNKKDTLYFGGNHLAGSYRIQEEVQEHSIDVNSLDNLLGDTEVTFIKMDIEGAEYEALIGAKNIIKKYKPKLAISLYHKPEDIFQLPLCIKELNNEYKFYIRHYATSKNETVLYAI